MWQGLFHSILTLTARRAAWGRSDGRSFISHSPPLWESRIHPSQYCSSACSFLLGFLFCCCWVWFGFIFPLPEIERSRDDVTIRAKRWKRVTILILIYISKKKKQPVHKRKKKKKILWNDPVTVLKIPICCS